MGHYKSNMRARPGIQPVRNAGLGEAPADEAFGDLDGESVREMLSEAARLAEGPVAESFADADHHPPTFDPDTHAVSLPESFKESLRAWRDGEWFRVGVDEDVGGVPARSTVQSAVNELVLGAIPSAFMFMAGPFVATPLRHRNEQQRHSASLAIDRSWRATMVLTGPDAGSDVGAGRTKRPTSPTALGTSTVSAVHHQRSHRRPVRDILHVVLARPEGAQPGTRG